MLHLSSTSYAWYSIHYQYDLLWPMDFGVRQASMGMVAFEAAAIRIVTELNANDIGSTTGKPGSYR